MAEIRSGFSFGLPDLESNDFAPDWGMIVTPDELRYVVMFGQKLVSSQESMTITNETLLMYIKHAIGIVEIKYKITP